MPPSARPILFGAGHKFRSSKSAGESCLKSYMHSYGHDFDSSVSDLTPRRLSFPNSRRGLDSPKSISHLATGSPAAPNSAPCQAPRSRRASDRHMRAEHHRMRAHYASAPVPRRPARCPWSGPPAARSRPCRCPPPPDPAARCRSAADCWATGRSRSPVPHTAIRQAMSNRLGVLRQEQHQQQPAGHHRQAQAAQQAGGVTIGSRPAIGPTTTSTAGQGVISRPISIGDRPSTYWK